MIIGTTTDPNTATIVVALITAVASVLSVLISSRTKRAVRATHDEIKSPNGSRTGEIVHQVKSEMADVARLVESLESLIKSHTTLDEVRFDEIGQKMEEMAKYQSLRFHKDDNRYASIKGFLMLIAQQSGVPIPGAVFDDMWEGMEEEEKKSLLRKVYNIDPALDPEDNN